MWSLDLIGVKYFTQELKGIEEDSQSLHHFSWFRMETRNFNHHGPWAFLLCRLKSCLCSWLSFLQIPAHSCCCFIPRGSLKLKLSSSHYQGEMLSNHKLKSKREPRHNPKHRPLISARVITGESQHLTKRLGTNEEKNITHNASQNRSLSFSKELRKNLTFQQNFLCVRGELLTQMSIDVFLSVGKTEIITLQSPCCWNEYKN